MAYNEQILQKMRHAYQGTSLGEWKLIKTSDGQFRIMLDKTVIAVVNRLEDAVFIENAHRYLPGILGSIRGTVTPPSIGIPRRKETVPPVLTIAPPAPAPTMAIPAITTPPAAAKKPNPFKKKVAAPVEPVVEKIIAPTMVPKGVSIPALVLPKAGNLQEI